MAVIDNWTNSLLPRLLSPPLSHTAVWLAYPSRSLFLSLPLFVPLLCLFILMSHGHISPLLSHAPSLSSSPFLPTLSLVLILPSLYPFHPLLLPFPSHHRFIPPSPFLPPSTPFFQPNAHLKLPININKFLLEHPPIVSQETKGPISIHLIKQ